MSRTRPVQWVHRHAEVPAQRASKGDCRCTSAASFEARWRSHLRMTMRCVTFSLTWRRYLCYQMPRISLIEGRQPVTTDWWSGCGSCGRGSSPRLRAVRASSPPAPRPGRGVLRLSAIGGAGNACALPLARSAAWAELSVRSLRQAPRWSAGRRAASDIGPLPRARRAFRWQHLMAPRGHGWMRLSALRLPRPFAWDGEIFFAAWWSAKLGRRCAARTTFLSPSLDGEGGAPRM